MYVRLATWTQARDLCNSLGANLAPIFNWEDSEATRYYGTEKGTQVKRVDPGLETWIGVYRTSSSSQWCVERGTSAHPGGPTPCVGLQYTRWKSGEPNNRGGSEFYVEINDDGTHNDNQEAVKNWFVCHRNFSCTPYTVGKFSSTSGLSTCTSCAVVLCSWLVPEYRWFFFLHAVPAGEFFRCDGSQHVRSLCHGYFFSDKWPLYLRVVCSWQIPKIDGQYCVYPLFCREFSE
jgi:hypothetical protein